MTALRGGLLAPSLRLSTMPEGLPELTLGWEVIRWATKYLKHPNGERVGKRWEFVNSQIRFLLWWYALDEQGNWLFDYAVRRLAKGSGKSPFAALWALAELTAPVRLKDLNPAALGGAVGKPVDMPWVQIVATAESQTKNTMRMVRALAPKGSRLVQDFLLDPGKTQYFKAPEGTLEQITSSYTSAEGAEATAVVGDELEHWKPSNGGPELSSTLADNLAKSGSRMMGTCNAWIPGTETVAEADWDAWVQQEEGRTRRDVRILYDARIASPDTRLDDEESLTRALRQVYDDCWWVTTRAIIQRIWSTRADVNDSKRKYLNWPTAASDAWITKEEWAAVADATVVVADGDDIVMFFDGSKSRDATALVGCRVSDGHVFEIGVWEPNPRDPKSTVPFDEVDGVVAEAFDTWNVVAFFADVREFESYVHTSWPEKYRDQLVLHAVPTGNNPGPIAWDMRSHTMEFTRAAETCREDIHGLRFTHDGSAVTARHVGNLKEAVNRWGTSVRKESPGSPNKIDAGVCVIGARMVRARLLASKEWRERDKKTTKRPGRVRGWQ